ARSQAERDRHFRPVHRWLRGKLDLLECDGDRGGAIIATLTPDPSSPLSVDEYRRQRGDYLQLLLDRELWLTGDVYGRVHTNLTSLESELLPCLSVHGQHLVEIDVANSQPLLLAALVRIYITSTKWARLRLSNRSFKNGDNPYHSFSQHITHNTS